MNQADWSKQAFYRVSLKALIRNDKNEILMVSEYEPLNMSLPGGGMDYGESPHECLKRELQEEIGLTSDFTESVFDVQTKYRETRGGWWLMWIVYEIHYDELNFSIGKDGLAVQWVNVDELGISSVANEMLLKALRK